MNNYMINASNVNSYILPSLKNGISDLEKAHQNALKMKEYMYGLTNCVQHSENIILSLSNINRNLNKTYKLLDKKLELVNSIENKTKSKISDLASKATTIGATTSSNVTSISSLVGSLTNATSEKDSIANDAETQKAELATKLLKASFGEIKEEKSTGEKIKNGFKSIKDTGTKFFSKTKSVLTNGAKSIKDTGAKVVSKVTSGLKEGAKNVKKKGKKLLSKVTSGFKSLKKSGAKIVSKVTSGITKGAKTIKDTGAKIISKAKSGFNWLKEKATNIGTSICKGVKSAWNWVTDIDNWKRVGASIANGAISLVKGVVSLVEALGDLTIILGSAVSTIGTGTVDIVKGLFTGNWDWAATKKLWDGTKSTVSYQWTNELANVFYETKAGEWLDKNAYKPFKSDGMGCKIIEGIGYVAGIIALTVATGGIGGAAAGGAAAGSSATAATSMAATAAAAGVGKYTSEAWNDNGVTINYNGNDIKFSLDYEQYTRLEELKNDETMTLSQQFVDENGNPINVEFTFKGKGNGKYEIVDSYGNVAQLNSLDESSTFGGIAEGTVKGAWEGLQYYVGGKIGTAQFGTLTNNISSPVMQNIARSGIRVGLDVGTGIAEVPFQSAVTMIADQTSWNEAWTANGGWNSVIMQAGIAGITSFGGEAFSLKGNINATKAMNEIPVNTTNINQVPFEEAINEFGIPKIDMPGDTGSAFHHATSSDLNAIKTQVSFEEAINDFGIPKIEVDNINPISSKNSIDGINTIKTNTEVFEEIEPTLDLNEEFIDQVKSAMSPPKLLEMDEDGIRAAINDEISRLDPYASDYATKVALLKEKEILETELIQKMSKNLSEANPSTKSIDLLSLSDQQQVEKAAKVVYDKAISQESAVTDVMKQLVDSETTLEGLDFRIKSLDSIQDKLARNLYQGYDLISAQNGINDSLRYTLIVKGNYEETVLRKLCMLKENGFDVDYVNNAWGNSTYQGLNVTLRNQDGLLVELQFHTPSSFNVKQVINHELYELSRNTSTSADIRNISNRIQAINQKVYVENNVSFIYKDRHSLNEAIATFHKKVAFENALSNAKKYELVKYIATDQLKLDYGDAGLKITKMLRDEHKSIKKIMKELSESERIEFQDYLNNTIEGRYIKSLTQEELSAITRYTGGDYQIINNWLRTNNIPENERAYIDTLNAALAKFGGTKGDTQLFRGIDIAAFIGQPEYKAIFDGIDTSDLTSVYGVLKTLEGKEFSDAGYMSTSPSYSHSFATWSSKNIVLNILAEDGTPGAYINQVSQFYNAENEFLLAAGTQLEMVEVKPPTMINGQEKIVINCIVKK